MSELPEPPMSRWRWPLYAAGGAMTAYGLWGEVFGSDVKPVRWAELLLVAALAHDLVLAPVVLLLGLLARRVFPGHRRGLLQGAALVAFDLLLIALPGMGRYGARSDNTSILPRDYTTGLVVALAAVVAVTAVAVTVRTVRRRP